MNAEQRRALEKEFQDILKITNPLVPATLDPNNPTAMSVPEVESELARRHAHTPGGTELQRPGKDVSTSPADTTPSVSACSDNQPQISGCLYL